MQMESVPRANQAHATTGTRYSTTRTVLSVPPLARNDKQLQEIEEAWAVRDKGFNCVWVGEALYKEGSDATEHPGAIIKSMRSKSSLRFASPKASSGKGEGAREYLGDIMM